MCRRRSGAPGCIGALVDAGLASSISGSFVATAEPFLYTLSATATEGTALDRLEAALLEALERVRRDGVTPAEVARAKAQLHARLVFDNDSVTNIAHQLGYFETIGGAEEYAGAGAAAVGRHRATRCREAAGPLPARIESHGRLVRSAGQSAEASAKAEPLVTEPAASAPSGAGLAPARVTLDNGAVVIVRETRKTPAVSINLALRAGSICDPADAPGATHLLGRVIDRGTATRVGCGDRRRHRRAAGSR